VQHLARLLHLLPLPVGLNLGAEDGVVAISNGVQTNNLVADEVDDLVFVTSLAKNALCLNR
jgi:hypothetical protein